MRIQRTRPPETNGSIKEYHRSVTVSREYFLSVNIYDNSEIAADRAGPEGVALDRAARAAARKDAARRPSSASRFGLSFGRSGLRSPCRRPAGVQLLRDARAVEHVESLRWEVPGGAGRTRSRGSSTLVRHGPAPFGDCRAAAGGRGGHRAARADCGSALRRGAWKRRLVRRTTRAGGSRDRNGTRRVVGRASVWEPSAIRS